MLVPGSVGSIHLDPKKKPTNDVSPIVGSLWDGLSVCLSGPEVRRQLQVGTDDRHGHAQRRGLRLGMRSKIFDDLDRDGEGEENGWPAEPGGLAGRWAGGTCGQAEELLFEDLPKAIGWLIPMVVACHVQEILHSTRTIHLRGVAHDPHQRSQIWRSILQYIIMICADVCLFVTVFVESEVRSTDGRSCT